jgi:cysteinyl-tRNA synthetase
MLRYFLLATHYRSPLDFSDKGLLEAKNAEDGFYHLFERLKESEDRATADKGLMEAIERSRTAFRAAMDDDFNTSVAIAELQRLKGDVNKLLSQGLSAKARKIVREEFRSLGKLLGLFQLDKWQTSQMPFRSDLSTAMPPPSRRSRIEEMSQTETPLSLRAQLSTGPALTDEEIEGKRIERDEARKQKNFKKADEIRQFLKESHGITIEDKPDGTSRWYR